MPGYYQLKLSEEKTVCFWKKAMEYIEKNDYIVSVETKNDTEVATLRTVFTICCNVKYNFESVKIDFPRETSKTTIGSVLQMMMHLKMVRISFFNIYLILQTSFSVLLVSLTFSELCDDYLKISVE